MTRTSPPQVAFSSGELDPLLHRRFDYLRHQTGLAACRGFLPLPQGGFTRAPGTIYRGRTRNDHPSIMVPFLFASDDALVLEFSHLRMRVWRYGELVMKGAAPYELVTPYPEPALQALQWVQSADVIYLCDGLRPIHRLSRFALDSWTIAQQVIDTGPFRVSNLDKARTVNASAMTGNVTLTASAALFEASHVGGLMELRPTDNTTVPLWTSNEGLSTGDLRRYNGNVYRLTAGNNAGENPPVHAEGEALVDNKPTKWRFVSDSVGIVRITAVTSPTTATAIVLKTVPQGCVDTPTYKWAEGAWSTRSGYPATIELFDQRLVAAATPTEPRTVWFSVGGTETDFTSGTEADDGFAYTIAGDGNLNRIINLKRGTGGLHILALGEEYSARTENRNTIIGPTTAAFGADSGVGSSPARAIAPDGDPIFISRDRRRLMKITFSLQADKNVAANLSLPSQHLGNEFFEQIVYAPSPLPISWLRRADGQLVAMLHDPEEEVLGWALLPVAGGFVEAMAVSPDQSGANSVLYLIVRREIDGRSVRMVETQALTYGILTGAQPIAEACHFFAAREIEVDEPTQVFTVPHLVGETVYAWTDAGEWGPFVVPADGTVDLGAPVTRAVIGLFDDTHFAETLDITAQARDGNTMGRQKRMHSGVGIGVHRTAQGYVQTVEREFARPPRVNPRIALVPRTVGSDLSTAYSGVSRIDAPSGHAQELAVRITPHSGAPLTITAIVPIVQEAGR